MVWIGTCFASILLGLDLGLAAGLGVELISVVIRAQLSVLVFYLKLLLVFCILTLGSNVFSL